jgi:peptidoglycan/LPS O-acetylase OafA/YrhL
MGHPMAERTEKAGTLEGLTGIRFFAAMGVVLFHVGYTPVARLSPLLGAVSGHGYAAVGLFYVLSGFVLAYTYAGRRPDVRAFYVARFARVYPLYLLALGRAFPDSGHRPRGGGGGTV